MESRKKSRLNPIELKMKDTILSNVETATHLGIKHSKTNKKKQSNLVIFFLSGIKTSKP
jgi:hypothetical protein